MFHIINPIEVNIKYEYSIELLRYAFTDTIGENKVFIYLPTGRYNSILSMLGGRIYQLTDAGRAGMHAG